MASDAFTLAVLLTIVLSSVAEDDLSYEIQPGLEIVKESYTVIAQTNSPLVINCSVSPKINIKSVVWKKNGNPIIPRFRVNVSENHSLLFRQVVHRRKKGKKRNDEGIYDCFVENEFGTVLATRIKLLVAGIQTSFIKQPESQVAHVGGIAFFQCDIKAVPPAVYVWEKDKIQLPPDDSRYTTLPSGILQIYDVTKADAGFYRCRSYHGALQHLPNQDPAFQWRESPEGKLTVRESSGQRAIKFLSQSSVVKTTAGNKVVLVCIVDGRPLPKITWTREDGLKIRDKDVTKLPGGSLRLINVIVSDSGRYVCTATASTGKSITAIMSLIVQTEPEIFTTMPHRAYPRAHVVDFLCRYAAVPFPTLTWWFNGNKIKMDSRISITSKEKGSSLLRIIQSQESDSGYYQCFTENEVGYATAVARLKIEVNVKAPNPPRNVSLHITESDALRISWQPPIPKPCCPLNTYSVHCSQKSGREEAALVKKNTFLLLQKLKPFTNYTCYVTAYNHFGASGHSNIVSHVTPDATPLVAPKVRVISKTPTSIKLKWDQIPKESRRGVISQYRVYYMANDLTNMERFKKPAVREYLITELMPDTVYHIRLLAGTSAGFPELNNSIWPWVLTRTQSLKKPVVPPKNLNVAIQNTSSVVVRWDHDNTVSIDSFVLQVYKVDAPEQKLEYNLPSNLTNLTLIDLENNTYYRVSVSAFSKSDASIQVTQVFQTSTEASVPPAPAAVIATPISSFAVNLTWQKPEFTPSNLSYTVRWSSISSTNGEAESTLETETTAVVIKQLKPYTEYQFSIRSHSESAKGPFSKLVIARTNEGAECLNKPHASTNHNEMKCHLCDSFLKEYQAMKDRAPCGHYCMWVKKSCQME